MSHTHDTRSEVPVLTDELDNLLLRDLSCAVGVDIDRQRLSYTDSVGELDKNTTSNATRDQRLGYSSILAKRPIRTATTRTNPTSGIRSGTIDLGKVLSRESTSSVGSPTSVAVNDNLTTRQTGIALGSTNHESAGRVNLK